LLAGVPVDQPASEMNQPAMVVEVHTGPCPDPGSSPGVSTKIMQSLFLLILAIVFVYLLFSAKKKTRDVNRSYREIKRKIKDHYR